MFDDPQNLSFASDRLPWQRSLRWTRAKLDRRRVAWTLLLGIVLTAIELIGFVIGMHGQLAQMVRSTPTPAVQVLLIEQAEVSPEPPEVEPPTKPQVLRAARKPRDIAERSAPMRGAPESTGATTQTPALRLYDPEGRLRLPDKMPPRIGEEIGFSAHATPNADPFARRNPVPYTPTRFESVWAPGDETLGGEIIRKTTFTRTWRTPWGTEITCGISLLAVLGGCGWGYAPTATIEELKAMRADPPMPKPADGQSEPSSTTEAKPMAPSPLDLSLPPDPGAGSKP